MIRSRDPCRCLARRPLAWRARLGPLIGLLALCAVSAGCDGDTSEDPPLTLEGASEQITFGSTEALGPHKVVASITRVDVRDGRETARHEDVSEVRWQDWDNLSYKRVQDKASASEAILVGGHAWTRRGSGAWKARNDGEPYRQQLRSTWNAWEEALEIMGDRVQLTEEGPEVIEGRKTRRCAVSLKPLPEGTRPRRGLGFEPLSLTGLAWLDEASAVHIMARVVGVATQGNLTRTVTLSLLRSDFGADLHLTPPDEVAPPTTVLAPPPRNPSTR